jgi:hypothetical protein
LTVGVDGNKMNISKIISKFKEKAKKISYKEEKELLGLKTKD